MSGKLEQIRELNEQAWGLCKKDGPRAVELARQAQALLEGCLDAQPLDKFQSLRTQTYCLDMQSKPGEALSVGVKANQLAEQIGDKYLIASIQSVLGRIYWHIDEFPTSMDYYLNALKLVQTEKHPDLEISLINGLGLVQYGLENFAEALEYFKTCLQKAAEDDLTGRADANNNIAYTLHMLGRDQEGLDYGMAAISLFNRLGTSVGKMETLQSLGTIYSALGNYDQAMTFLVEGIEIARQNSSPILEISYVLEISRIHQIRGLMDQAEQELLDALQIAAKIDSQTNISLIHERLAELYKTRKDYRSALEHYEAFHLTSRKIFNDQSDRRIKNLEIVHQVEIARKQADLYRDLAATDFLTGLVNRRRFLEIVEVAFGQVKADGSPLAIMMLDVDHFKDVNDSYGHKAGDEVLLGVASSIRKSLRGGDVAGRYGGEEFVVLVVGMSQEICLRIAERIRQAVAGHAVQIDGAKIQVTVSLGLACTDPGEALPLEAVIGRADQAMYAAKRQGRNRVVPWAQNLPSLESQPAHPEERPEK